MSFKLLLAVLITVAASSSIGQESLAGSSIDTASTPIQKEELKNGGGQQSTSLFVHTGQPDSLTSRVNQLEAEFRKKIDDINTKTSNKSQHQEKEIEVLKTLLEEEKKFSKELSGRISQLEASNNQNSMANDQQLLVRPKRPDRLIPPHIPAKKNNKDGGRNQQFYGPATNCDELGLIGYTLNGYYMVKRTTDSTAKKGKIGVVYCRFQELRGENQKTKSDLLTLADFDYSELEVHIMDRVSHELWPANSKPMEQTKQIKSLGNQQDHNSLQMESKTDKITYSPENRSQSVTSIKPLPALLKSTVSPVLALKTTTTPEAKSPPNISTSSEDHKKCSYSGGPFNNHVECENVQIKNIKEFFKGLSFTNLFNSIKLILPMGDEWIPADILGNKKTEELNIYYDWNQSPNSILKVDVNAFQSTKNYTKSLKFSNIFSSQLDLEFLSGFDQLTQLELVNVNHFQKTLPTLPYLPKLTSLKLYRVKWLKDSTLIFPRLSSGGLKKLEIMRSETNHASISRTLDWILLTSAKTLETLTLVDSNITQIPSQIPSFTALKELNFNVNSISTIPNGALSFSAPVSYLGFWNNSINSIEPGVFQGDFRNAEVDLSFNRLTRFDERVFRPMLEQMASGRGSIQFLENSGLDCTSHSICHLAWFIRASNEMKQIVRNLFCSESYWTLTYRRYIHEVSKNAITDCPITNKPH